MSEYFLGCFPIPKLSLSHQMGPHPKPHHPPQNLLGSLHSEEKSCKSKKFQSYHQEWIGRDGSLTDKLLLKFSNLNTGFTKMLFNAITLFWKHFPCKKFENVSRIISLSFSYLDLVWIIATKEPVLSIPGKRWGAGIDHESSGNMEKQGAGGLTGRWTSSSCRLGRSRSSRSPIAGLHPCHPANSTISGCPAQVTLHDRKLVAFLTLG